MMNKSDIEERIQYWNNQEYSHEVASAIMIRMYNAMGRQTVCSDCEAELVDDKLYFNVTQKLQCFDCWESEYKRLSNKADLKEEIY